MKNKIYTLIFFFGIVFAPKTLVAQNDTIPTDDLGNVSSKYQDYFYEALKQKGIENYSKAVTALQECLKIDDSKPIIYFELGKNYNKLKNYSEAEIALKKAIESEPKNEWFLDELYDTYYQQKDFIKALEAVKKLVKYDSNYKEDLANLYFQTKKYDKALVTLDELDNEFGSSSTRNKLRNHIYLKSGKKQDQIANLEKRIKENPDKESTYIDLIYRYSESNQTKKAFETAKELLKINPNSQLVHIALYKFYLEENNSEKAIESMKIALKSSRIKPAAKVTVLSDFTKFVKKNPKHESDLLEVTTLISDSDSKSFEDLANYYLSTNNKEKALEYFIKALANDSDNLKLISNKLLLYIDLGQYDLAEKESKEALEKFPSQPILYLIQGVALNQLQKPNEAIESLETGLDYIIDNQKMEADFYEQLSKSHTLLNNTSKAKAFKDKQAKFINGEKLD